MAIRDLGYRPYDGERHEASHNTSVLLRHSMRRAWRSWVVKLALLFCWVPAAIFCLLVYADRGMAAMMQGTVTPAGVWLYRLVQTEWIAFGTVITLAAGAGAIGYDITHNAFAYFFSKPVGPLQYLAGRVGAVATLVLLAILIPSGLFWTFLVALAPEDELMERVMLLPRLLASATLVATVLASCAVGVSALSKSRALTMSAFIVLLIVPAGVAALGSAFEWPWLELISLPSMLGTLVQTLCGHAEEGAIVRWYHAAPIVGAMVAGCLTIAARRVQRVEVIV